MPLILPAEAVDTGATEQATDLLMPYPSELMRAHRVSKRVNKPKNDDSNLVIELEPEPAQLTL